jgi:hypothetical protein
MGTLLGLVLAASAAGAFPDLVRLENSFQAEAVRRALAGAAARMEDERCQAVLAAFRDGAGRTLRQNLDERGQTPSGFLGRIFFYDGDLSAMCRHSHRGQVFAFTAPGSHVVFVCGERFHDGWRRKPKWAEVALIHEALHTLGLGEDPPSSEEITSRVAESCAR